MVWIGAGISRLSRAKPSQSNKTSFKVCACLRQHLWNSWTVRLWCPRTCQLHWVHQHTPLTIQPQKTETIPMRNRRLCGEDNLQQASTTSVAEPAYLVVKADINPVTDEGAIAISENLVYLKVLYLSTQWVSLASNLLTMRGALAVAVRLSSLNELWTCIFTLIQDGNRDISDLDSRQLKRILSCNTKFNGTWNWLEYHPGCWTPQWLRLSEHPLDRLRLRELHDNQALQFQIWLYSV